MTVKHSAYNLLTRFFGYEATFVDSESGGFTTGFVETNDGYLTTVGKTALDIVTVATFGRGGVATGGLLSKSGWAFAPTIRQAARAWTGIKATRFKIADNFYRRSGYKNYDTHLEGVDFAKPVSIQTLKKGTHVSQWVDKETGNVGSYFTTSTNKARNLGISDYENRTLKTFELTENVKVLKSTAGNVDGSLGGRTQFFNTEMKRKMDFGKQEPI